MSREEMITILHEIMECFRERLIENKNLSDSDKWELVYQIQQTYQDIYKDYIIYFNIFDGACVLKITKDHNSEWISYF